MATIVRLFVTAAILAAFTPLAFSVTPGPKIKPSMGPQDYSNYRYHNHLNSDFSGSDRFDLKNPVEAEVRIHGVQVNEDGYVELLFTYPGDADIRLPKGLDPDTPIAAFRVATLQTKDEFSRLDVNVRDFREGLPAVLSGWPALEIQQPYSELLVDEIQLGTGGRKYVFHAENTKMVKFKDKDKPRNSDGESEPDPAAADEKATDG